MNMIASRNNSRWKISEKGKFIFEFRSSILSYKFLLIKELIYDLFDARQYLLTWSEKKIIFVLKIIYLLILPYLNSTIHYVFLIIHDLGLDSYDDARYYLIHIEFINHFIYHYLSTSMLEKLINKIYLQCNCMRWLWWLQSTRVDEYLVWS